MRVQKTKASVVVRLVFVAVLVCIALFSMVGCGDKTDKKIVKIQTRIYGGEMRVYAHYVRTFDFVRCTVIDEALLPEKDIAALIERHPGTSSPYYPDELDTREKYAEYLKQQCNIPKLASVFVDVDAEYCLKKIQSLGICNWKDKYISNDILDATSLYVTLIFSDGTTKTTEFYCQYPENYEAIEKVFQDCIGVGLRCEIRVY